MDVVIDQIRQPFQKFLYLPPTGGLPSALMAILLAILLHRPDTRVALAKSMIFRVLVHLVPLIILSWLASANVVRSITHPVVVSLMSAIDRPVTVALCCITVYGFLHDYQGMHSLKNRFNYIHNIIKIPHHTILKFPGTLESRNFRIKQRHEFLQNLGRAQYDPKKENYVPMTALVEGAYIDFCKTYAKCNIDDFNMFLKTI